MWTFTSVMCVVLDVMAIACWLSIVGLLRQCNGQVLDRILDQKSNSSTYSILPCNVVWQVCAAAHCAKTA